MGASAMNTLICTSIVMYMAESCVFPCIDLDVLHVHRNLVCITNSHCTHYPRRIKSNTAFISMFVTSEAVSDAITITLTDMSSDLRC